MGEGGIGIVRLSGKDSIEVVEKIFTSPKKRMLRDVASYKLVYGHVQDPSTGETVDEVLVAVMRFPHSYTREDTVEINCHSGMVTLRRILELALKGGARLADPGEFTKRAFIAVADKVEGTLQDRPEKEISTEEIGAFIMQELKRLDKVAYIRFASVYRSFEDVDEFAEVVREIRPAKRPRKRPGRGGG